MEPTSIEEIAKTAAKEAVTEIKRQERKNRKVKIFQNTKALMENYNRIVKSVEEGVSDLADLTDEPIEGLDDDNENIFIQSIVKSKLRSLIMLAHVDRCLKLLENEEYEKNTPEKYMAFKYYYMDGMTYENISEVLGCADRTCRRWVTELTQILSIYLFGADALLL